MMLAVGAWFWYPRLMQEEQVAASAFLPSDTWAMLHLDEPGDHDRLVDSLATLRFMLPEAISNTVAELPKEGNYWIYLYGSESAIQWGLLSDEPLPASPNLAVLADQTQLEPYHRYQTKAAEVGIVESEALEALFELESPEKRYVYLRPLSLLKSTLLQTSNSLTKIISQSFERDAWIGLELEDEDGLFRLMGVEQRETSASSGDASNSSLLNYLPAQSGAGLIELHDSIAYAVAYCPYQLDDTTNDLNLFLFTENLGSTLKPLEAQQDYQSIPVSITSLDSLPIAVQPAWMKEAYVAQLSSHIRVYGASFQAIASVIDDYLADDRLISSPYYQPLEPYISDASFTLFMRPDILRVSDAYVLQTRIDAPINTLIYQSFEELPFQQFHSLSMLHDRQIKDLAPVAWNVVLDTVVARGPWLFKNHYNQEPEILVQDADQQLYLINKDGRILWKRKFDGLINGKVDFIDGFDNNKLQMVFATPKSLHFVDRNGNEVQGFPIALNQESSAGVLCVRYNNEGDYRLITNSGGSLVNYSTDGKPVKGWTKAKINGGLDGEVKYLRYGGKDYLVAMDLIHRVHILDRAGNVRQKAFDIDTNVYEISLVRGERLEDCRMIGHDSLGNLYSYDLNGKSSNENLLPLGSDVGLSTTDHDEFRYITNKADRVIALDKSRDVSLDFLMPEALSRNIYTLRENKDWIGLENSERTAFYLLDLNGRLLDKMPLSGQGPAVLVDLDQNGSTECVLSSPSKGLVAYKLAD